MKKATFVLCAAVTVVVGCGRKPLTVGAHRLGESVAEFNVIEKSTGTQQDTEDVFTGTLHCYDHKTLGNNCQGSRLIDGQNIFDNAHYTFVGGRLVTIEFVGLGGLIGEPSENINWNLYLEWLTKRYGHPTKMTLTTAVWMNGRSVIYAYLELGTIPFSNTPTHTEHILFLTREAYMTRVNATQSENQE